MLIMNYSQARQNLSSFLDQAKKDGSAVITRADGSKFTVIPAAEENAASVSPFAELAAFASSLRPTLSDIPLVSLLSALKEDDDDRTDRMIMYASGLKPQSNASENRMQYSPLVNELAGIIQTAEIPLEEERL